MEQYIPETYKEIIGKLKPVIEKYELDRVSIESLVRSCVKVEEQPVPPATVFWRSGDGKVYTIKPSNIKVNLKFALSTVFRLKTIITAKDIWIVLSIVQLIVDLFSAAKREVDKISALAIIAIYRIQHGDLNKIYEYACKIYPQSEQGQLTREDIEKSIKYLEEWNCIRLENGEYVINETVTNSMIEEKR